MLKYVYSETINGRVSQEGKFTLHLLKSSFINTERKMTLDQY